MEEGKKYPKGVFFNVCVFYFTRKMGFNLQEALSTHVYESD